MCTGAPAFGWPSGIFVRIVASRLCCFCNLCFCRCTNAKLLLHADVAFALGVECSFAPHLRAAAFVTTHTHALCGVIDVLHCETAQGETATATLLPYADGSLLLPLLRCVLLPTSGRIWSVLCTTAQNVRGLLSGCFGGLTLSLHTAVSLIQQRVLAVFSLHAAVLVCAYNKRCAASHCASSASSLLSSLIAQPHSLVVMAANNTIKPRLLLSHHQACFDDMLSS